MHGLAQAVVHSLAQAVVHGLAQAVVHSLAQAVVHDVGRLVEEQQVGLGSHRVSMWVEGTFDRQVGMHCHSRQGACDKVLLGLVGALCS